MVDQTLLKRRSITMKEDQKRNDTSTNESSWKHKNMQEDALSGFNFACDDASIMDVAFEKRIPIMNTTATKLPFK